jgi:hypothetical protein
MDDIITQDDENGADNREVTFSSVFQMLEEVLETLSKQNVRGEAAKPAFLLIIFQIRSPRQICQICGVLGPRSTEKSGFIT